MNKDQGLGLHPLKAHQKANGLTVKEIAFKLNCTDDNIYRIYRYEYLPCKHRREAIANMVGVSPDDLTIDYTSKLSIKKS
jgi:hypothetical protein